MNNPVFQTRMNTLPVFGMAGQNTLTNPIVYYSKALKSSTNIECGTFVWLDSDDESGESAVTTGASKPLGVATPLTLYANPDMLSGASNEIPKSNHFSVCIKGDIFLQTTTAALVGQKVFADLTNGSVKVGKTGTSIANAVETDYVVVSGGNAGESILVSNWLSV